MKKIIITGNVGRDPETRADQEGNTFATFSVGVSVGSKQNPKTDWVDVVCNGRFVDLAKNYIKKGSKLLIEGFPSVNAYINKENKPVGTLRVYVNNLEFIGSRPESGDNSDSVANSDSAASDSPVYDLPDAPQQVAGALKSDDIPF